MSQTEMESHAASSVTDAAANSGAELIDQLGSILYVGAAAIFIMVMILALYGCAAQGLIALLVLHSPRFAG